MARRKGTPVHGWLVLDKPQSITSTHALNKVKRLFNADKAGHAGTLDPLATGILPIAFGEATKTIPHVVDSAKEYASWCAGASKPRQMTRKARWPAKAPSVHPAKLSKRRCPIFAAPSCRPRRASPPSRSKASAPMILHAKARCSNLSLGPSRSCGLRSSTCPSADSCRFEALCGKGTYVRAIARDLGRIFGCFGHVAELRRTRVGPFPEASAISLERLTELGDSDAGREALIQALLPVETALDGIPALAVNGSDAAKLKRGKPIILRGRDAPIHHGLIYATSHGTLVALGEVQQGELRPSRVFNIQL